MRLPDLCGRPAVAFEVGEHRVDCVGNGIDQTAKTVSSIPSGDPLMQFGEGELAGAIDSHKHGQLALLGPHLGDIDVEIANRIRLERSAEQTIHWIVCSSGSNLRFRSLDVWQTADVMTLQQAMQG